MIPIRVVTEIRGGGLKFPLICQSLRMKWSFLTQFLSLNVVKIDVCKTVLLFI